MERHYYIYIVTNQHNTTFYIGITGDLKRRIYEHKAKLVNSFSSKYNLSKLVYYEITGDVNSAIAREKQLKDGPRRKKIELVNGMNPSWNDLYPSIL
jgi:putative endonuclease